MIHPLLHLIATQPQLLGDHMEAYAELVGAEVGKTSRQWMSRALAYTLALLLLMIFVTFTGISLMLWAAVPTNSMNALWLLVVVPLAPLLAAGFCLLRARSAPDHEAFETLKRQFNADLAMLREVNPAT